jgi:hypothetical protein
MATARKECKYKNGGDVESIHGMSNSFGEENPYDPWSII